MRYYRACLRYVFSSLLLTAATLPMAGNASAYCESYGFPGYEWISGVYSREFLNVSGSSNQGYTDFTDQIVNLIAIPNHVMLASEGNVDPSTIKYWKIWIDYNHDDHFAAEETAFSGSSSELSGGYINLPETAVNGTTRMRISMGLESQI